MTDAQPEWMTIDLDHDDPRERATAGLRAIDAGGPAQLLRSTVWPGLVAAHDQFGAAAEEVAAIVAARPERLDLLEVALEPLKNCESSGLLLPVAEAALARGYDATAAEVALSILHATGAPAAEMAALLRQMRAHDDDRGIERALAWMLLLAGEAREALELVEGLGELEGMEHELRRLCLVELGDAEAARAVEDFMLESFFGGDAGLMALGLCDAHHSQRRWVHARAWAQRLVCPPATAADEALTDFCHLSLVYGRGDAAVQQMRATWGEDIPGAVREMVARVFKQFDADYAATALRLAYETAGGRRDVTVLKFDQAVLAEDWEQALALCEDSPDMYLWLPSIVPGVDVWERGIAAYQEAMYRGRPCVTTEFNIPMARGDLAAARALADEIDRYYPDGDSAAERYALIDALEGNLEIARANLAVALRKDPDCVFGLIVAALIAALEGEWDEAVRWAELAHGVREAFYVTDVDALILEAHRGGDMLEQLIEWHRGVVYDAPYEPFWEAVRAYAATRA